MSPAPSDPIDEVAAAYADRSVKRETTPRSANVFATAVALRRLVPHGPRVLVRRGATSNGTTIESDGDAQSSDRRIHQFDKVLRLWRGGLRSSPQLVRINSALLHRSSLAVKGDALIHGPSLAARPVGSDWRTRRPYQRSIHIN